MQTLTSFSFFPKILQKVMYKRITQFFKKLNILTHSQYGFKSGSRVGDQKEVVPGPRQRFRPNKARRFIPQTYKKNEFWSLSK